MKRRGFVATLAAAAYPKLMLALNARRTDYVGLDAHVVDGSLVRVGPSGGQVSPRLISPWNIKAGDRVLVLRDLTSGSPSTFFSKVLPGDDVIQVLRGLGRTSQ